MGNKFRKDKITEIRKNDIIDVAEKIFFAKGYMESTMDDLAREAEYSKRTLYMYFESKREIYMEIMLRGFRMLNKKIENDCRGKEQSGIGLLEDIGKAYFAFAQTHPGHMQAIMDYDTSEKDLSASASGDGLAGECYLEGEKTIQYLVDALKHAKTDGTLSEDIDIIDAAVFLWASLNGFISLMQNKAAYIGQKYQRQPAGLFETASQLLIRSIVKKQ